MFQWKSPVHRTNSLVKFWTLANYRPELRRKCKEIFPSIWLPMNFFQQLRIESMLAAVSHHHDFYHVGSCIAGIQSTYPPCSHICKHRGAVSVMVTLTILEIEKKQTTLNFPSSNCYRNILRMRELKVTEIVYSVYREWSKRAICGIKQVSRWDKHYCIIYSACPSKKGDQRTQYWHLTQSISKKPALINSTDAKQFPQRMPPSDNSDMKATSTHHCVR